MIRSARALLVILTLLAAAVAPTAVRAATAADCQQQIDALSAATDASTFIGKNAAKEETGLLRTLGAASETLAAGKLDDTVKKLSDFQSHTATIGQAGKLAATDAADLVQGADDAIACVTSIGA